MTTADTRRLVDVVVRSAFDAVGAGKMWLSQDAYLPLFGPADSLATEVKISQWTQTEGLRYANQVRPDIDVMLRSHRPLMDGVVEVTLSKHDSKAQRRCCGSVLD